MNIARAVQYDAQTRLTAGPVPGAARERPGVVVSMQIAATRRENLRAFDALVDGMRDVRAGGRLTKRPANLAYRHRVNLLQGHLS
jgi:hypothetical protein